MASQRESRRSGSAARVIGCAVALACGLGGGASLAQKVQNMPPTDTSVQASPLNAPARGPVVDSSNQASPVSPTRGPAGPSFATGEVIPIHLGEAIDSGRLKNGENVPATLDGPVQTQSGTTLPAGTAASVTVIGTVPAGRLTAAGEFSLQLVRVGNVPVFTDVQTFRGKPGHQDLPDSAPAIGTDAGLPAGAKLTFKVQPAPSFAAPAPTAGVAPGSVNGVAIGQTPPPNAAGTRSGGTFSNGAQSGNGAQNGTGNGQVRSVQPADNTFGPAQNLGQPSVAPNQPHKPSPAPGSSQPQ